MAYTPLRLSIPEPCHESWEGMTPVAGTTARHCDSCVKNVVDFTGFSDAQLHAYTKENGANICGRFRPDQLGRPLRETHKPNYTPLKVAATAAGVLFGSAALDAQSNPTPTPTPTPTAIAYPEIMGEVAPMPLPDTIECGIPSISSDGYPEPIIESNAPMQEAVTGKVTTNDTIHPPILIPEPVDYEPMIMGLIYIEPPRPTGLDSLREMLLDTFSTPDPALTRPTPHPDIMRGQLLAGPRQRPETPQYLEDIVISPNPLVRKLRIEIDAPGVADLNVELLSASGQSIMSRPWPVSAGRNEITIEPKLAPRHGIIFVRITDEAGARVTRPIVVRR